MSLGMESDDTRVCAVCKKRFDVLYPDLWRFKKQDGKRWRYYCSWGHMRKEEREEQMEKMTRQAKKKAPGRPKKTEAEEKVETGTEPEDAEEEQQPEQRETVELVYDPGIAEEYRREQAAKEEENTVTKLTLDENGLRIEKKRITRPLNYGGLDVTAVRHPELGEFYYDKKCNIIDLRTPEGDEVSLTPILWTALYEALPMVLNVLGFDIETGD